MRKKILSLLLVLAVCLPFGLSAAAAGGTTHTVRIEAPGANRPAAVVEQELRSAITDGADIVLADGLYTISDSLEIYGVKDVTIRAENAGKVEIVSDEVNTPVIVIGAGIWNYGDSTRTAENVMLHGLILGHKAVMEGCGDNASVVFANNARDIIVDTCDLWGCGSIAVYLRDSKDVNVTKSILRDCKINAVTAEGSSANFYVCTISGNAGDREWLQTNYPYNSSDYCVNAETFYGFTGERNEPSSLYFESCEFLNNWNPGFYNAETGSTVFTKDCIQEDNAWQAGTSPRNYGLCLGGQVWQAFGTEENGYIVEVGGSRTFDDGYILGSLDESFPNYSEYSAPWKNLVSRDAWPIPFTDVSVNDYYHDAVVWSYRNSITQGAADTLFDPLSSCSRGQVVTFLWRAKGCPEPQSLENPFADVSETDYYYKAVLWAREKGITDGMTDTTFGPDVTCKRAYILTFLWRCFDAIGATGPENWLEDTTQWARGLGLLDAPLSDDLEADCPRSDTVYYLWLANTNQIGFG